MKKVLISLFLVLFIGFLFLIHGLGFAYLSFICSIGSISYLIYRLKGYSQYKSGKMETLKFCSDVVVYILVLVMIFISIFPIILFFPAYLKNGNVPSVELYFNSDQKMASLERARKAFVDITTEIQTESSDEGITTESQMVSTEVFYKTRLDDLEKARKVLEDITAEIQMESTEVFYKTYNHFKDKQFLQGFLLKFPVNIGIDFSSYNVYSFFVFILNIIYFLAGIHFLIVFPVIKMTLYGMQRQRYMEVNDNHKKIKGA